MVCSYMRTRLKSQKGKVARKGTTIRMFYEEAAILKEQQQLNKTKEGDVKFKQSILLGLKIITEHLYFISFSFISAG